MNSMPLENPVAHKPHASDGMTKWQRLQLLTENPMTIRVICQQIAEGVSLKAIADGEMVPYGLLQEWIYTDKTRLESYRNAERMYADSLIFEAVARSDDDIQRNPDGTAVLNEAGNTVGKDVKWARLQVTTRLKAAQLLDSERFVQAVKTDTPPLSDDGIAHVARHLAGAFERRNLPGSEPHQPQDIEEVK